MWAEFDSGLIFPLQTSPFPIAKNMSLSNGQEAMSVTFLFLYTVMNNNIMPAQVDELQVFAVAAGR